MREETLEGTLVRKRPLAKRLVFLSILESDELPIVTVVIKEECGGVGGAAEARSALKLGDRLRVCGAYESAESTRSDEKVLRATHVQVTLPWRVVGGGAAWQHNARDSQPSAVPPKPPEQETLLTPRLLICLFATAGSTQVGAHDPTAGCATGQRTSRPNASLG